MNTHPTATLHMANGSKIVIELLPEAAPNTVNSFIYAASRGFMDHHAIQRIVPGNWVDVTYQAFGHKECQYLIPNEFELHPEIEPLDSHPGCVCMGGYGEDGLASCEFFFPLRDCPDHKGIYPVFGKVIEGMDELLRELRYQGNNLNQLTVMARQGRITQVNYEPFTEVYRNAWQTLNSLLSHAG